MQYTAWVFFSTVSLLSLDLAKPTTHPKMTAIAIKIIFNNPDVEKIYSKMFLKINMYKIGIMSWEATVILRPLSEIFFYIA